MVLLGQEQCYSSMVHALLLIYELLLGAVRQATKQSVERLALLNSDCTSVEPNNEELSFYFIHLFQISFLYQSNFYYILLKY